MHRSNLFPRKNIPIVMAAIFALHSVPAFASIDTETGAAGMNGANGTGGINTMLQFVVTPGQPGMVGGFLEAEASGTTASDNFATDTGGNGGNGGKGAASGPLASNGGDGGAGGFALSNASQTFFISGTAIDLANSTGGTGGTGGSGPKQF